jgi:hypothetical protein
MTATVTHNTKDVIKSTKKLGNTYNNAAAKACLAASHHIRDAVRKQVPAGGGSVGLWDGYKATGTLRKYIVSSAVEHGGKTYKSRVYVRGYERTKFYAEIHNKGGIIRAKQGGWLRFPKPPAGARRGARIPGNRAFEKDGYIFAKAVRIRRKNWARLGVDEGRRTLPERITREFMIIVRRG